MSATESKGVYQLPNGMWGYRYAYMLNGKQKDLKRTKDENGNPFKTERAASKAREAAIIKEHLEQAQKPKQKRMTLSGVYEEYCLTGLPPCHNAVKNCLGGRTSKFSACVLIESAANHFRFGMTVNGTTGS